MPNYSNVHAHLDNSELHPPKDFVLAASDTLLGKNPLGGLAWFDTFWQRPVLGFTDGSLPPLTSTHGDRYILLNMGTTAISGTAFGDVIVTGTAEINTTIDGTATITIVASTAHTVVPVLGIFPSALWGDVNFNDIVEYFAVDNDGATYDRWRKVVPKEGYIAYNKGVDKTWCYDGAEWVEQQGASGMPQSAVSVTRAEALDMISTSALVTGQNYWLSDRSILLQAIAGDKLSDWGPHTRPLLADGYFELTTGVSGYVNDVQVNGVNLLTAPVSFTTSLELTAQAVATAIAANQLTTGYFAYPAGRNVVLLHMPGGDEVNGHEVTVSATDITVVTEDIDGGENTGINWFSARYDINLDHFICLKDEYGNSVEGSTFMAGYFGMNPCDVFPWGKSNIWNNTIIDSLFVGRRVTGAITGTLARSGCYITLDRYSGAFFSGNTFVQSGFKAAGYSGVATTNVMHGADVVIYGSGCQLEANNLKSCTIAAPYYAGDSFSHNIISKYDIDLTNAGTGGADFRYNHIHGDNDMNLEGFTGNFYSNEIYNSDFSAVGMSADIDNNQVRSSTFTADNATGTINANIITDGDVDLTGYTGTGFIENHVRSSMFTAVNASGEIMGNRLENNGRIECNYASGRVGFNKIYGVSDLFLNHYTGDLFGGCELSHAAQIYADYNSSDSGGIIIKNKTILNIEASDSNIDGLSICLPYETFSTDQVLIDAAINRYNSSYSARYEIDGSGCIDVGLDGKKYAGEIEIDNSATLNTILNINYTPENFIIKAPDGISVTLDSSTSTNIILPSTVSTVILDGSVGDFIVLKRIGTSAFITTINQY